MNTEDPIRKITAAEARTLLPELEESGLSVAEFARQRNVDRTPLYNARRAARVTSSKTARAKFGSVTVLDNTSNPTPTASGTSIVVELRNGIQLRIPQGFDDVSLRRVLAVVGAC